MRTPAQILAALARSSDPGERGKAYGLTSPAVTKRFVTLYRKGGRSREQALSYVRNQLFPASIQRAVARIKKGRTSGLGPAVDAQIRRASDGSALVQYARAKAEAARVTREDAFQTYEYVRLDDIRELRFVIPELEADEVYITVSPADLGLANKRVAPGRSDPDGASSTRLFPALQIPDVFERLARSEYRGPVDIVIRGLKLPF